MGNKIIQRAIMTDEKTIIELLKQSIDSLHEAIQSMQDYKNYLQNAIDKQTAYIQDMQAYKDTHKGE